MFKFGQEFGAKLQEARDRGDLSNLTKQGDFLEALTKINKSVAESDLGAFEKWMAEFGST